MARVHVIYDPKNQVQIPTDGSEWAKHLKVAVIDIPEDEEPGYIEETARKLAVRLIATFHQQDV